MNKPYLSVIIPAYNEEINLKRGVLSSVYDYLKKQDFGWEVLIVDDKSKDNTVKIVSDFVKKHVGFRLMKEHHRGKGGTVIAGMLEAQGEIVLFTDMDQATPIDQVGKLLPKFVIGNDIVIGSRRGRKGAPFIRKTMAIGFSTLRRLVLNLPFKDTQCGFKAFRKGAAKVIFAKMKLFSENSNAQGAAVTAGFDIEVLFIAKKLNYKIAEVTVDWYEYGERKEVSPIKDSWEGFRDLIKIKINDLLGKYNVN